LIFSFFSLLVEISITSPHLWKKDGGGRMFHGEVKGGGDVYCRESQDSIMYTEDATSFIHPPTHPRYFPFDKK
jgi:hypothetical protein